MIPALIARLRRRRALWRARFDPFWWWGQRRPPSASARHTPVLVPRMWYVPVLPAGVLARVTLRAPRRRAAIVHQTLRPGIPTWIVLGADEAWPPWHRPYL